MTGTLAPSITGACGCNTSNGLAWSAASVEVPMLPNTAKRSWAGRAWRDRRSTATRTERLCWRRH
eukprot:4840812-Alexandrium_andersonii.AAC.1